MLVMTSVLVTTFVLPAAVSSNTCLLVVAVLVTLSMFSAKGHKALSSMLLEPEP